MEDGAQLVSQVAAFMEDGGREAGSEGERACQERLAGILAQIGMDATVEGAVCPARFATVLVLHASVFLLAAALTPFWEGAGLALSVVATWSFWGELRGGPDLLRRILLRRITGNMVARAPNPKARARLLLVAHADTATATALFHPWVSRVIHWRERPGRTVHPGVLVLVAGIAQMTAAVLWKLGVAGPAPAITLGAAAFVHAGTLALAADWRSATPVDGALDNGSGLAVVSSAARALVGTLRHVELWVVATGSRELDAGGMESLLLQLSRSLDPGATWLINVDDVGRGELAVGVAEGRWQVLAYRPSLPGLAESVAAELGVTLPQVTVAGTTDAGPATRAGIRAVTLLSLEDGHRPAAQHTRDDTLAALDPQTMVQARDFLVALAHAVDRRVGEAAALTGQAPAL
jgi:acetylornithine deacetylase/succinyl-diaminopimelate desuccinylase-like protein